MPQSINNVAYSLGQSPLTLMSPLPVVSKTRAPTTADKNYPIGQLWVVTSTNASYILTSVVNNLATWTGLSSSIGASVASLTITGAAPNLTINSMSSPGVLVNSALGSVTSQALTNGQVLIGSTGAAPVASTLTAGAGVAISNGAGSITISVLGSGETWSSKVASFAASAGNGYVITAGSGSVTMTLPTNAALGDEVDVVYPSATAGDILIISATAAKLTAPGDATARTTYTWPANNLSGAAYPSAELVCTIASGTVPQWTIVKVNGSPTGS